MPVDLTRLIRPGDLVMVSQVGAEPASLVDALLALAPALGGIRLLLNYTLSDTPRRIGPEHGIRGVSIGGYGANRHLADQGLLDIVPAHFSDPTDFIARGLLRPDVVLVQATPGEGGRHSLGVTVDHQVAAMAQARVVVAELNDQAPWTHGDAEIDGAVFAHTVAVSRPLLEWRPPAPGAVEHAIAGHVAGLVPDRPVLQYGVGAIPDAIVARLARRRDLAIHSGSLADSFVDLMEAGAVDNGHKEVDGGVSIATTLYGTRRLYGFVHRNPKLRLKVAAYTHGPAVLARFGCLVCINSALQVDLTGQVGAEAVAGRNVGAVGGQAEYQRAAVRSPRGRGIVTLPSQTRGRSNIVAALDGPATVPRSDADAIVTEWGVAELRGRTLDERARAMLAIAHPDHRTSLAMALDRLS